jgi:Protein of unknown function (DUF3159)
VTPQPDNGPITTPGAAPAAADLAIPTEEGEELYPTFSEQVAAQLGGVRGMIESSIPVIAFVIANTFWALRPALMIAVGTALLIAAYRFTRRHTIRHAINGLFGIALGALIAWRTGSPKDFYLPGIVLSLGYGVAMVISVGARRPLVGWIWSVVADNGRTRWRDDPPLRRVFDWLTVLWAGIYFAKVAVQSGVYFADALTEDQKGTILGITRILLGFPPYALLLAITVWAVRRHLRANPPAAPA